MSNSRSNRKSLDEEFSNKLIAYLVNLYNGKFQRHNDHNGYIISSFHININERKADLQHRFRNIQSKGKNRILWNFSSVFFSFSNPARIASFAFFVTSIFSFVSDMDVADFGNMKEILKFKHILWRCSVFLNYILTFFMLYNEIILL